MQAWFDKARKLHAVIGVVSLLLYEFPGRRFYRSYIHSNGLSDCCIADTLGNTIGLFAAIFCLLAVLRSAQLGSRMIAVCVVAGNVVYEACNRLFGRPVDLKDIVATLVTGTLAYGLVAIIEKPMKAPPDEAT